MLDQTTQASLLQYFNISQANPRKQAKFLEVFQQLSEEVVMQTILDGLDDIKVKMFIDLAQQDISGEKAMAFAKNNIPDLESKISGNIKKEMQNLQA